MSAAVFSFAGSGAAFAADQAASGAGPIALGGLGIMSLGGSTLVLSAALAGAAAWSLSLRRRLRARTAELGVHRSLSEPILSAAPVIILTLTPQGRIDYVNAHFEALTGYSLDEVRGKDWFDSFLPERDRTQVRELFFGAIKGVSVRNNLNPIVTRSGEERLISWSADMMERPGHTSGFLLSIGEDVTERVNAEKKLRESEVKYRDLIEGANDLIFRMSIPDGRYEYVSPSAEQVIGYPARKLRETPMLIAKVINPDDKAFFDAEWNNLKAGIIKPRYEYRTIDEDGRVRWLSQSNAGVWDGNGNLIAIDGVVRNETQRMEAEAARRDSDALIAGFFDNSPQFMVVKDAEGRWLRANRQFHQTTGFNEHEVVGKQSAEIFGAETARMAEEADAAVLATGHMVKTVIPTETLSGVREYEETKFPIRNASGRVVQIGIVGIDISNALKREQALRDSEAELLQAQRVGCIGSWEYDFRADRLTWSDQIYVMFGVSREEFVPTLEAFYERVHSDDREMVMGASARSLETREPYAIAHRLTMPDGGVKWVEERCETQFDEHGCPQVSIGTVQDITDLKLAEQRAEASARENEILLREVHHRVKNNLQVISSLLYFGLRELDDPASREVLTGIRSRLTAMAMVHERLYRSNTISRVELLEYARALVRALEKVQGDQPAEIVVSVEGAPIELPVDIALPLGMLLCELVTNAQKHAFADRAAGRIDVELSASGDSLTLSVRDDGIGLPKDFEARGCSSFGLRLACNIADQLDADLRFVSGPGTMVRTDIPLGKRAA